MMGRGIYAAIFLVLSSVFSMNAFAQVAVGQVWTFKDATAETARIAIYKIETLGDREAVHVSIYNLPKVGMFNGEISHMPFERKALESSLDQLTEETAPPADNLEEGYRTWQAANGGIFTITIAQAVKYVMDTAFRATPFVDRHKI